MNDQLESFLQRPFLVLFYRTHPASSIFGQLPVSILAGTAHGRQYNTPPLSLGGRSFAQVKQGAQKKLKCWYG